MRDNLSSHHQEFVELWNEDTVRIKDIAKQFDVSRATVQRYAVKHRKECPKRYKIAKHNGGKKSRINHQEFVELWNDDTVLTKDIAKRFGVTRQNIYLYASKHREECHTPRGIGQKRKGE